MNRSRGLLSIVDLDGPANASDRTLSDVGCSYPGGASNFLKRAEASITNVAVEGARSRVQNDGPLGEDDPSGLGTGHGEGGGTRLGHGAGRHACNGKGPED